MKAPAKIRFHDDVLAALDHYVVDQRRDASRHDAPLPDRGAVVNEIVKNFLTAQKLLK
ncbi:MAG TPA: hypothetical protein VMW52_08265 [Phycisphaerae bacterium]|nr:hypothetical protein [Phycisphaerae bacterium]